MWKPNPLPWWWGESLLFRDALRDEQWLPVASLEHETGASRNTVAKWMARLVEYGYAEVREGPRAYRRKKVEESVAA